MDRASLLRTACAVFIVFALLPPAAAVAASDREPECADLSAWMGFTHILLTLSYSGSQETGEWDAAFDYDTNDILIRMNSAGSAAPMTGSVAMVGGRVMLSKGLDLKPGYEIDAIDAPVLGIKLLMNVLERVFPQGPDTIPGQKDIDHTYAVGIKFATPSASGYIPPPWTLKGAIRRLADSRVGFDLALSFPVQQGEGGKTTFTTEMTGMLGMLDHPVFRDTDSLNGWTTYGVGMQQTEMASGTIVDYGARPEKDNRFDTIGDIRAFIAAENHPGFKDPAKDFTGFWKETCDQAFGLQIMHRGDEGKYSVVFCGPGGCGDPAESRLTFITGDRRYEVVSEDEVVEIGRSGDRTTYHRCTRETHPVLRYGD